VAFLVNFAGACISPQAGVAILRFRDIFGAVDRAIDLSSLLKSPLATMWPTELAAYIRSLTPQHVLASAFGSHLIDFDAAAAAAACKLPIAYIGAVVPMANLSKFREFCPHLKVGQILGSGHFSTLLAPEQVNAMIQGFERAYVRQ
jgi:pimeloyl-ACP methyl ester carboxylesterase